MSPFRFFCFATLAITLALGFAGQASASSVKIVDQFITPGEYPIDWGKGAGSAGFTPNDPGDDDPDAVPAKTQAGSPVALNFGFELCENLGDPPNAPVEEYGDKRCNGTTELPFDFKDLSIDLPAGMIGDSNAAQVCEQADFYLDRCPAGSLVGWIGSHAQVPNTSGDDLIIPAAGRIYNVRPLGDDVAFLGAAINPQGGPTLYIPTFVRLREESDFGISSLSTNNPTHLLSHINSDLDPLPPAAGEGPPLKITDVQISLFARAGDPTDDSIDHPPFLRMPTTCADQSMRIGVNSYDDVVFEGVDIPLTATGCDASSPPFDPKVEMQPTDSSRAGTASGYKIAIQFPENGENEEIHQSHLKEAKVTLPPDIGLNPAAARQLEACTDTQFKQGVAADSMCPEASKIGDVEVLAPVLDGDRSTDATEPLTGSLYFGQPKPGNLWPLLLEVDDAGIRVKLRGRAEIDEQTGQITNVFEDLPQVPFERFAIKLRGGPNSILVSPSSCGNKQVTAEFTPWNEKRAPVSTSATFEITGNGAAGTGCEAPGFAPSFTASSSTEQAGAFTKSQLGIAIPERSQRLRNLDLALPAGLLGSLTKTSSCAVSTARAGDCGADSQIGRITTSLGTGAGALQLPGRIHLADPLRPGDAASLAIIVPNKVGPIDLGTLTIMNRVVLRSNDGGLTVLAEDLPNVYRGVPIEIRNLDINIDREEFLVNPTGCGARPFSVTFRSHSGSISQAGSSLTPFGCQLLSFDPKLRLVVTPGSKTTKMIPGRNDHTGLKAIVTQPAGQAAISNVRVLLPDPLRPDTVKLNQPGALCNEGQLAQNACPARSQVGTATAVTPLLPEPLSGPVYLVQELPQPIPKLAVMLGGRVALQLNAKNRIEGVRTANYFEGIPDVPVTRFELNIDGGRDGILFNFKDLCSQRFGFDARFDAQNGASKSFTRDLEVPGCSGTITTSRVRMTRTGKVKLRVACAGDDNCEGRVSLRANGRKTKKKRKPLRGTVASGSVRMVAGSSKTFTLRLSKAARRELRKNSSIKTAAQLRLERDRPRALQTVGSKQLTVLAPRKKKKKK